MEILCSKAAKTFGMSGGEIIYLINLTHFKILKENKFWRIFLTLEAEEKEMREKEE